MSGWLHVITGPMYSGKTEILLRYVRRYEIMGKQVHLFRPSIDDRTPDVTSRAGVSFPAVSVSHSQEIWNYIEPIVTHVIAIDEAQFLDEELADSIDIWADSGIKVIVAGLDRDFLRRPFGPMEKILSYADEVDKLSAVCFTCKGDATLTQRLIDGRPATPSDPLILVGGMGDDAYEARCREHHVIGV